MSEPTITVTLSREAAEANLQLLQGERTSRIPSWHLGVAEVRVREALDSPQPERYTVEEQVEAAARAIADAGDSVLPWAQMPETHSPRIRKQKEALAARTREHCRLLARAALSAAFPDQLTDTASQHDAPSVSDQFPDQQPVEGGEIGAGVSRSQDETGVSAGDASSSDDRVFTASADLTSPPEQEGEAGDWPELWIERGDPLNPETWGIWGSAENDAVPYELDGCRRYIPAPAQHPTGLSEEFEDRFQECDQCERPTLEKDLKTIWCQEPESGEQVDARICLICRLESGFADQQGRD